MEEKMITLTIDRHVVVVPDNMTILDAAKTVNVEIPTLCHINLEGTCLKSNPASCRLCVVEVDGRHNLVPACATQCRQGMVVHTSSPRVLRARKTVAELILSDHPNDCLTCPKCSDCEVQRRGRRLNFRVTPYNDGERSERKMEITPAITRDMSKCIYCRRCESVCNEVQTVGALGAVGRGFGTTIGAAFGKTLGETNRTYCGQCVAVCPVGALTERDYAEELIADNTHPDKIVVAQTAPAVRYALGEEFGLKPGSSVTGKMVTALKDMGFDYVFDTDFGADMTIMEEGSEIIDRMKKFLAGDKSVKLPIMTSCCPAWVNFYEHEYPDLLDYPSSAKSPAQMFGAVTKTYWAEKMGIPRDKLVVVSIMPCLAKKYECGRPEFKVDDNPDVDYSITTRELAALIRRSNINFDSLPDSDFDRPLGKSTGAAAIFGTTGGVIEAALRTVYEEFTGKTLPRIEFDQVRGLDGFREANIDLDGFPLKVCVVHTLSNARMVMDKLRAGKLEYHVVEVMACPGGCIGGAGQPYHHGDGTVLRARQRAAYAEDAGKQLRKSHDNPDIQRIYKEFLGKPLHGKAHELLHTCYSDKSIK